ncbi:hypothetical protein ACHAW5_005296 [Stephanodiscus triporus]|uniref:RNA helicase n=1 Tax=Stephanodiscus triporus TaxID=2934178 RepID=A0ABD3PJ66_9STRA
MLFSATFPEQIEKRVERVLSRIGGGVPLRLSTTSASTALPRGGGPALPSDADVATPISATVTTTTTKTTRDLSIEGGRRDDLHHDDAITPAERGRRPRIQHRVIRLKEEDRTLGSRLAIGAISFVTAGTESHFDFLERRALSSSSRAIKREVLDGFAIDEAAWASESAASSANVPGSSHSQMGLGHDRMFGGVKGRRKSKKDKLREAAATAAAAAG